MRYRLELMNGAARFASFEFERIPDLRMAVLELSSPFSHAKSSGEPGVSTWKIEGKPVRIVSGRGLTLRYQVERVD